MIEEKMDGIVTGDSGYSHEDTVALACPACGCHHSHIREVYTAVGTDKAEARVYEGTRAKGTSDYRRSALCIRTKGECEHEWTIIIQQHKGVNLLKTTITHQGVSMKNIDAGPFNVVYQHLVDEDTYHVDEVTHNQIAIPLSPSAKAHLACLRPDAFRRFLDVLRKPEESYGDVETWLDRQIDGLASCSFESTE